MTWTVRGRLLTMVLCLLVAMTGCATQLAPSVSTNPLGPDAPTVATDPLGPFTKPESKLTTRSIHLRAGVLSYCGTGSLDRIPAGTKRVVFVVHGNDREPCGVAKAVLSAATREQLRDTLIIAPRFGAKGAAAGQLDWTFSGWSQGDDTIAPGAPAAPVSSFAVMDELLERAALVPRVVVGFSGGGQFVGRYLVSTTVDVHRFVIANPSSYLYFTPERPGADPALLSACPAYDDYRYGLQRLTPYLAQRGAESMRRRFVAAEVDYLIGDKDSDPTSLSMDRSCAANAQGATRIERAQRYFAYLPTVFGPGITRNHRSAVVPGVGHDPRGVFRSQAAKDAIFG